MPAFRKIPGQGVSHYCSGCERCVSAEDAYADNRLCKACQKVQAAEWNKHNPERRREINRAADKRWRERQPKQPHAQAMPIVINGISYPSHAAAAKALGVHYRKIAPLADPREGFDIDF